MTSSTPSGWPEKRNASVPERVAPHASIAEALDRGSERLAAAGLPSARREATALWAAVAGKKPGDVWLSREESPLPQLVERFGEAVARRARGVPFAYAVGRVGFRTLELALDPRALIPRPETEGLVDLVLKWAGPGARAPGPGYRGIAADIGTGCGCIAVALAVGGDFEPREALVSGVDGLDGTRALLAGAAACFVPQGLLAVEIDERRAEQVRGLALGYGWDRVAVHDDLFGRPRFLLALAKEEA